MAILRSILDQGGRDAIARRGCTGRREQFPPINVTRVRAEIPPITAVLTSSADHAAAAATGDRLNAGLCGVTDANGSSSRPWWAGQFEFLVPDLTVYGDGSAYVVQDQRRPGLVTVDRTQPPPSRCGRLRTP